MTDRLYSEFPALYDTIQSEWDYDRDVSFLLAAAERHGVCAVADGAVADGAAVDVAAADGAVAGTGDACLAETDDPATEVDGVPLLEVGCGTGEHTRRLAAAGFAPTAVDPNRAVVDYAREKAPSLDADFVVGGLPELPVAGTFPVVVAFRGVLNHLPPAALDAAVATLADRVADDGLLVFDVSDLPPDGHDYPALDVGEGPAGTYARIVQMHPRPDGRLDWDAVVFPPDGEPFVDSRPMTPFDDETVRSALVDAGLSVETHEGFGPDDDARTVFVARPAE
ncbi:class I SAM-dependent methyltransferase [Halobaculum sp. MBLA0147]|uniref:class I SAM-dependent methyltransferase n=1 Tax=Halobaculum sp. MBLA0147 TaxID=3079934 RepID=UPI003524CAAE